MSRQTKKAPSKRVPKCGCKLPGVELEVDLMCVVCRRLIDRHRRGVGANVGQEIERVRQASKQQSDFLSARH